MGVYETAAWSADTWGMTKRDRRSGAYHPYAPDCVADFDPSFPLSVHAAVSKAERLTMELDARSEHLTDTEPLARLILRAEAVASSRIEGYQIPVARLLEHEALDELGVSHRVDGTEAAVLGNIQAMMDSIDEAAAEPVTVDMICDINRRLLAGTDMQDADGCIRTVQNWIGGSNYTPIGAAYVPPRPELVRPLLEDLVVFINESEFSPVVVAAIAHAQLETIHPFADGNGRTGRALVHAILRRRGMAKQVLPPVSLVLATDKRNYIANLAAFRTDDADPQGPTRDEAMANWVEYFSGALALSCVRAAEFEDILGAIQAHWRTLVGFRAGSAGDTLLEKLVGNPVISMNSAIRLTGRSREAVRQAIKALVDAGILSQNAKNRKSGLYVANDVVSAFGGYERSLAVPSGDTAAEKPVRRVPQRPSYRLDLEALVAAAREAGE